MVDGIQIADDVGKQIAGTGGLQPCIANAIRKSFFTFRYDAPQTEEIK